MATTFPLASLSAVVTAAGISAPPYADIYTSLQASFQSIYGSDAYIDPDSQDGQLLAIVAAAINDSNMAAIAAYNAFSPTTALGAGLSSVVKINGIKRATPTSSTVLLTITGQVGTTILNGVATDTAQNKWLLPATVTIPPAGFIIVTATNAVPGAAAADVGTVTQIATPQLGWQSVTNASAAAPGNPVESDATLRQRQTTSTALPSLTVKDGITGAIAALPGVVQVKVFENDTKVTDANGQPANSIAAVVVGGVAADIENAIYLKKTPGTYSYGTTVGTVIGVDGLPNTIRYFVAANVAVKAEVTIKPLTGYSTAIGNQIKAAVAAYISALGIAKRVDIGRLYLPAQLFGGVGSETFEVNGLQIAVVPAAVGSADIEIAFNARATCLASDIVVTVVP